MGFLDTFKGKQYKQEVEELQKELERIKATFTPEMAEANRLQELTVNLNTEIARLNNTIQERRTQITYLDNTLQNLNNEISQKQNDVLVLDEEILMESFGLYKPQFDFATSDEYSQKLKSVRDRQKAMIKAGTAVSGNMNWQVNGSTSKGNKMVKDTQKLLLRAFNSECDEVVDKVKFNNYDKAVARITKAYETISKLGNMMSISITQNYLQLKLQELALAFEYRQKKQEEKEEQKRIREELREQAKLEKEIEEQRKKIAKEQTHYSNQLDAINKQLAEANLTDEQREALEGKISEITNQLSELDKSMQDVDYRAANQKAGYVYVISNIGAFGENVYKIGMTRRLDPLDRVNELGDASVPFNFDVHAMIFSDNAPALEAALHKAFENRKVNMVNTRREFFNVTLEEIESEVKKNFDKTVEFTRVAPAEQYRESVKIKQML